MYLSRRFNIPDPAYVDIDPCQLETSRRICILTVRKQCKSILSDFKKVTIQAQSLAVYLVAYGVNGFN